MHATIATYRVGARSAEEIVRRIEAELLPLIGQAPGFVSWALATADHGEVMTIGLFDKKTDAEGSVKIAAAWAGEKLSVLAPTPPAVVTGPVLVRRVKPGARIEYAIVRRYKGAVGPLAGMTQRIERDLLPLVVEVPGFAGYALIDGGRGLAVTVNGFLDRAGADDSSTKTAWWIRENLGEFLPNPPEVVRADIRATASKDDSPRSAPPPPAAV